MTDAAAAAAAVEDLFLRGEYAEALAESQAKLAQRTLEVRAVCTRVPIARD